jgi:Alpha/beta hydrolase of unknown function (DUF900)
MSHFLLFPTNENGIVLDEDAKEELVSLANPPFDFNDFFIYSHGWWTDSNRAMAEYNRFSVEFTRTARSALGPAVAPVLGTGIHWPSMLSEDSGSITNYVEALSFYTMEKRADSIGEHGGFLLLRTLFDQLAARTSPYRIHLIGHSFGCKVVSSILEEIATAGTPIPPAASVNVVLLQAALDNNSFDTGECYEDVLGAYPGIRFLISRSTEDAALQKAYPEAHRLANLFGHVNPALGAAGPSPAFQARFAASSAAVTVDVGFKAGSVPKGKGLVVADLSPLHQHDQYTGDAFTGHHSDVFHPEIYELLLGFLF